MNLRFLISVFSLLLISCNSFNTYHENTEIFIENAAKNPTAVTLESDRKCGLYRLPDLPPIPPIPLNEIKAHISDIAKVDAINVRHIKELRNYIHLTQRKINESYQTYLNNCAK